MDETAAGFYCNSEGYMNETAPPLLDSCPISDETAPPTVGGAGMEEAELEGANLLTQPRKVWLQGFKGL